MPAQLRVLEDDQTTVVTSDNMGNVPTPGTSTETQYYVNNFGTVNATSVIVSIEAFGTNDGDDYTQIAEDVAGSPGTWGQSDIDLGTIAPLASEPFWVRVSQPAGLTADNNPRRSKIAVDYLTL